MKAPPGIDDNFIRGWLAVLDDLTYYELFGLEEQATADDVRHAFHRFAYSFHPDQHRERAEGLRQAIDTIFRRGNEAFLVLSDPYLRAHYDRELPREGRPPRMSDLPLRRDTDAPARLEDKMRIPSARPFARRAEELVQQGDFRQAKLQLVMARFREDQNPELDAYLKFIESNLKPIGR